MGPLFELAGRLSCTRSQYNPGTFGSPPIPGMGPGFGSSSSSIPTSTQVQVQEKPFFAKPTTLVELQHRVLAEVQRRRPTWRVTSTSGAQLLKGPVTVVRTIIESDNLVASDRSLKNLAFGFGLIIWP